MSSHFSLTTQIDVTWMRRCFLYRCSVLRVEILHPTLITLTESAQCPFSGNQISESYYSTETPETQTEKLSTNNYRNLIGYFLSHGFPNHGLLMIWRVLNLKDLEESDCDQIWECALNDRVTSQIFSVNRWSFGRDVKCHLQDTSQNLYRLVLSFSISHSENKV